MSYTFDKDKATSALENLSTKSQVNIFRDDDVFELVQLINYCMDLEDIIKEKEEIINMLDSDRDRYWDALNAACDFIVATTNPKRRNMTFTEWRDYFINEVHQ